MEKEQIFAQLDFTMLRPGTSLQQVMAGAQTALDYGTAAFCLAPAYVERVHAQYPQLKLATVVGFPLGYNTTAVKAYEAAQALSLGAAEIDMVINIDDVKSRRMHRVLAEISALRKVCEQAVLKVIVETCSLTQEEKRELAGIVEAAGADYIKTSTGFGAAGAQLEDVRLFHELLDGRVKIKAAGGIRTLAQMQDFLAAGAERIGSSADLAALAAEETAGQQS